MDERRANGRTDVKLKAIFRKDDSYVFNTKITNISMSGLFMETSLYMNWGTKVVVDIDAENIGQIIGVYGLVVRNTETGAAVEFTRVDANLDRLIKTEKLMTTNARSGSANMKIA
jgi:hypothetical protein